MATQNQGSNNKVYSTPGAFYDNPAFLVRQSASLGTLTGSGGTSTTKFTAFNHLILWGVTFYAVTALGSSTYTVNGTATTSAMSAYYVGVANTSTTSTPALLTSTISSTGGPFFIGGTGTANNNVNVQSWAGTGSPSPAYFFRYALNTLGGTNTSLAWGTTTYISGYPGSNSAGLGGLYMNPGDQFYVVAGTDATGTASHILEYSLDPGKATLIV